MRNENSTTRTAAILDAASAAQHGISRALVIETATQLFLRHGVRNVTLDRLVKEMHTSKRTIYSHFADKTDLLKVCLAAYYKRVKQENEDIISASKNCIEAMGHLHRKIISRAYSTHPNFFSDILYYHPGVLHESYRDTGSYAHRQLVYMAEWGIRDGIFREDIDVDVTVRTVLTLLKLLHDNDEFPAVEYSQERLTFGIMIPYLRGLCTLKGLKLVEEQEELYRVSV